MRALFSRPPMIPVLFLPTFSTKMSGRSFSSFLTNSSGMGSCCVAGSPQPAAEMNPQKMHMIEVTRWRMAGDLVGRDEITERLPLGYSDGPETSRSQAPLDIDGSAWPTVVSAGDTHSSRTASTTVGSRAG